MPSLVISSSSLQAASVPSKSIAILANTENLQDLLQPPARLFRRRQRKMPDESGYKMLALAVPGFGAQQVKMLSSF